MATQPLKPWTQGHTLRSWNEREWAFRFDEIRPYLATKNTAKGGLNMVAKARPDEAIIAAAIVQGKVKRIPKGMRTIH